VTRIQMIQSAAAWLGHFTWGWVGRFDFQDFPSRLNADRLFRKWIQELKDIAGVSDFRWIRIVQRKACAGQPYFRALVGGLSLESLHRQSLSWKKRKLRIQLRQCDPARHEVVRMLRDLDPSTYYELDVHVPVNSTGTPELPESKSANLWDLL
jgi:hypothetical protein